MLSGTLLLLLPGIVGLLGRVSGKWVEGHIDTKQNWAFLSRFCFLSLDGQFEYLIEFNRDMGIPNLLLYYDDQSQWPSVYHSQKSCKEKEAVLNKAGQNQIIKLSHWYPEMEFSGCVLKREDKELPASKSSTTTAMPTTKINTTTNKNKTTELSPEASYYDQFLKTTTNTPKTTTFQTNSPTTWYDVTIEDNVNTTELPDEEFWESIGNENNNDTMESLKDVEILFPDSNADNGQKIKRSTFELYERYKRRRISAETGQDGGGVGPMATERIIVSCHNARRFRSSRERWWFIAISNCDSPKGLDVKYKFLMTNGAEGDFWHLHFSADEFYVLPVLLAYVLAYVVVMIAVVMCSVELKSRHLLHATYKLFLVSVVMQHFGVVLQALAFVKYASNGINYEAAKTMGQFFCGLSEMSFLLLLILMAKGYTITRGRLKVGFTVKLTVFMCCYCVTYIILFVYQAKAFDPGEVLYLYESPPGYGLIVLRIAAWAMFAYSTFFTVKKYPEKNMFYGPFFICGSMWFYAGPLFILTANSYIDKWVRESVVIAVLLFITFCGHIMFLLLTLPVFANKNFPYHVRTTQIGVMEVTGSRDIDGFGHNAYHPANGTAQTVIIPLTRRTEELIGNMYNQYMATAPPISLEDEIAKQNGGPKSLTSISPQNKLIQQDSTDTNTSEDIMPSIPKNVTETTNDNKIFTIDGKINEIKERNGDLSSLERKELPTVLRSKRNILEPINKNGVIPPPPSWSLAKGPASVPKPQIVENLDDNDDPDTKLPSLNPKKVPSVRNGLQNSTGEISTILEGHVQDYSKNTASKATIDLFNVKNK